MCTNCSIGPWLQSFAPVLQRNGVGVGHHNLHILRSGPTLPKIAWEGHPLDGMWREYLDQEGILRKDSVPIERIYENGCPFTIEVHENVSPPQLTFSYHAQRNDARGIKPYTFGAISVSLNDLSVRYYVECCGEATELPDGHALPEAVKCDCHWDALQHVRDDGD